jgi:hypothetical protein
MNKKIHFFINSLLMSTSLFLTYNLLELKKNALLNEEIILLKNNVLSLQTHILFLEQQKASDMLLQKEFSNT